VITATADTRWPIRTVIRFDNPLAGAVQLASLNTTSVRELRKALQRREAELIAEGFLPVEIEEAA
jgi:hypothetical protein